MAIPNSPSGAPVPPAPTSPAPERGRSLLWWILGLVALAVVVLGLGATLIASYFASQVEVIRAGSDGVEVRTPVGTLRAQQGGDQQTGLPEYPGARISQPVGTVELAGDDEESFLVTAAKYRTPDRAVAVDQWYGEQLGSSFVREAAGTMVRKRRIFGAEVRSSDTAYIEETNQGFRFVIIRSHASETEVALVRIGKQELQ